MKNRSLPILILVTILITIAFTAGFMALTSVISTPTSAESVSTKSVSQDITASGSIHSQNEATLHFPIAGKVVYLPFKEGDSVAAGQTIAALDQRAIVETLKSEADTAQNQQLTFDSVNEKNGSRDLSDTGLSVAARRELQTAINTLDQAKISIEIQKIAQEQALLVSPINGIITNEDITTPNVNVALTTSFSVADPTTKVFRANVRASDIDFVSVGAGATIRLDGQKKAFSGTIQKIYPQKTTLTTGEDVYQVDIQASDLSNTALFGQAGSVIIKSNNQTQSLMVPTWAILGHNTIWVLENNRPVVKSITVGKVHNEMTEVTSGLSQNDKVIANPEKVAKEKYWVL